MCHLQKVNSLPSTMKVYYLTETMDLVLIYFSLFDTSEDAAEIRETVVCSIFI